MKAIEHPIPLSPERIAEFYDVGFLRVDQVFSPAEMDAIDAAFERLHAIADEVVAQGKHLEGGGWANIRNCLHRGSHFNFKSPDEASDDWSVQHIAWCGAAVPELGEFGEDRRLLSIASQLLGADEMDHLINQAHFKRPGTGVAFPWHQDSTRRGIGSDGFTDLNGKGSYVQMALAIDDMTPDNGPLSFIPGSSRLGHLGMAYRSGPEEEGDWPFDEATAVTPLLKRGDVAAFGPYTIHGSEPNRSDKARRVFINGFAYPGANHREYAGDGAGRRVVYAGASAG